MVAPFAHEREQERARMARSITRTAVVVGVAVVAGFAVGGAAEAASPSTATTPVAKPHTTPSPHNSPKPATAHAASTHRFPTKHALVRLHAEPNQTSPVVGTMVHAGSEVTVRCYTRGTAVSGNSVWYRTAKSTGSEYVAGSDLRSGHDPAAGVPRC
jgi:hypothetical protein